MTLKDLEIIITNDEILDMLVYSKCLCKDIACKMTADEKRYDVSILHDTLKEIQYLVNEKRKNFHCTTSYRKCSELNNFKNI